VRSIDIIGVIPIAGGNEYERLRIRVTVNGKKRIRPVNIDALSLA
jgi:hypothetical protein